MCVYACKMSMYVMHVCVCIYMYYIMHAHIYNGVNWVEFWMLKESMTSQ